jgi:hypothetical protein
MHRISRIFNMKIFPSLILGMTPLLCSLTAAAADTQIPETIGLENIRIAGELNKRINRNFDRLESQRFQPIEDVGCLRDPRYSWPGDMEGRTILSLALLEQVMLSTSKRLWRSCRNG